MMEPIEFLEYLNETIIPNLRAQRQGATADDFQTAATIIRDLIRGILTDAATGRRYHGPPRDTGDKVLAVICGECGKPWQTFGNDECCVTKGCQRGRKQRMEIRKAVGR